MAKILLVKGDIPIKELSTNYTIVQDVENQAQFITKNLDGVYPHKVIEASLNKVPVDTLRWIAAKSIYPVIMFFVDGKIPEGLNKTGLTKAGFKGFTNEIETVTGTVAEKEGLFDILEMIINDPDRMKVYQTLTKNAGQHFIIMRWLVSNAHSLGTHNVDILSYIDMMALFRDSNRVAELLAFSIKPVFKKVFMRYAFPKKEKE